MKFIPIDKMWERIETVGQDSDSSLFLSLMYLGEMITKIVTLGLVAAIGEDRDKHRYRQLHSLVRADSLGDWVKVVEDVLTGPSYQFLILEAKEEQRELTQRCERRNLAVRFGGPCKWLFEES